MLYLKVTIQCDFEISSHIHWPSYLGETCDLPLPQIAAAQHSDSIQPPVMETPAALALVWVLSMTNTAESAVLVVLHWPFIVPSPLDDCLKRDKVHQATEVPWQLVKQGKKGRSEGGGVSFPYVACCKSFYSNIAPILHHITNIGPLRISHEFLFSQYARIRVWVRSSVRIEKFKKLLESAQVYSGWLDLGVKSIVKLPAKF